MEQVRSSERSANLRVENIGGIDETEVELGAGVTVLAGRNATNRTSLLKAIMAVLGSEHTSLKGDADRGRVELTIDGETYTRTLERRNGTVVTGGDPYLDDPELADLFAFLLETNEARLAVSRQEDLREIIMRPVDTAAIRDEIERLEAEKRQLDAEIEDLDSLESRLPGLEERRESLRAEIAEKEETLEETEAEIERTDASVEETREEKASLQENLERLRETRSSLEDVRFRLETEQESLTSLREERASLEEERADLPESAAEEIDALDAEIERLRERRQALDGEVSDLQSIVQFNERMLEGTNTEVLDALRGGDRDAEVTDRLVGDETVLCWTCGSEVDRTEIEATLDRLRDLRREKFSERQSLRSELDDRKAERSSLEESERQRERVQRRLERVADEIDDRESRVEELEERRAELTERVADLEEAVEALEHETYSEVLALHREANEIEFELGRLQSDLDEVNEEVSAIESDVAQRERLRERRAELVDELADLRTRIEETEKDAVENFNEHVETVLDLLGYANLERIWIERVEREVREGRRSVDRTAFELHIVRTADSGATYEDTIDHLSESERRVTALVFALAGYLVHDVHEVLPFMLLDSLEAIDSERIAELVEYFEEYAGYLVVALLPEDAAALDDEYPRVTDI